MTRARAPILAFGALAAIAIAIGIGIGYAWGHRTTPREAIAGDGARPDGGARPAPREPARIAPETIAARAREARWIAIGGGAEPASNQVSLEQDIALLRSVLGDGGLVLFAGGQGAGGVQVLDAELETETLATALGELFDARASRTSRYRAVEIAADGPSRRAHVVAALESARTERGTSLLVWIGGHGDQGEAAAHNAVLLWGGESLTVAELATLLDEHPHERPLRIVATTCFSGGFAEVAFRGADAQLGAAGDDRCGVFATTWDAEASGCDPDPDRRTQESYGLHLLHALRGEDRAGEELPRDQVDFDGDGRISLLEAHARARIASRSIDVPTTTSERWLEAFAPDRGREAEVALPEEDAVIAALGAELGVAGEAAARARLAEIEAQLDARGRELDDAETAAERRARELRIALLERWPVLDDPFHPDFAETLRVDETAIEEVLRRSAEARAWHVAKSAVTPYATRYDDLHGTFALYARLVRAYDTRTLARRLAARGGHALATFERLRACERAP